MRVRLINRRDTPATALQSTHDNIFGEVSNFSAPRGIPAKIDALDIAQVLRPDAFNLAMRGRVTRLSAPQMRGICGFQKDSEIITQQGVKPIGALSKGEHVLTRDNGFQPVVWTAEIRTSKAIPLTVKIAPDAVMNGKPEKATKVPGRQSVLLTCPEILSQFGSAEVLARAGDLLHLDGFSKADELEEAVVVLTAQHELLNVNGLWMDSLRPDAETMSHIAEDEQKTIKQMLPNLGSLPIDRSFPSARTLLRTEFARQFTR